MAEIAVIVPVYNCITYLDQCVGSVLGQTYQDLELYLVDDGSTDGSGDRCDEYAVEDPRVHVIHKDNEGLMATWMRGVRESSAPFLCFLDGDDWVDSDMLERMYQNVVTGDAYEAQIICSNYVIEREWNHTSEQKYNAVEPGAYEGEMLRDQIQSRILGNETRTLIPSRCMKLFSRSLLSSNMKYCDPSIRMGEDVNITTPCILDAKRIVVMEKEAAFYHYRFVSASMVHQYDAGLYDNIGRLCKVLHGIMADKKVANGHMQVDREYVYLFLLTLKNEIRRKDASGAQIRERIQSLCHKENGKTLLQRIGGTNTLQDKANRLLAFVCEHPSTLRIGLIRTIFQWKG